MLIRPVFEIIGTTISAIGLMLIGFVHSSIGLFAGGGLLLVGAFIIYRHYVEMGDEPDDGAFHHDAGGA